MACEPWGTHTSFLSTCTVHLKKSWTQLSFIPYILHKCSSFYVCFHLSFSLFSLDANATILFLCLTSASSHFSLKARMRPKIAGSTSVFAFQVFPPPVIYQAIFSILRGLSNVPHRCSRGRDAEGWKKRKSEVRRGRTDRNLQRESFWISKQACPPAAFLMRKIRFLDAHMQGHELPQRKFVTLRGALNILTQVAAEEQHYFISNWCKLC